MTDNTEAKHADDAARKHAEDAKKRLGEEREARQKAQAEHAEKMAKVRPTPTQEENDLAASGVYIERHEDDGSGPDPNVAKQAEAKPAGTGYATRVATPQQQHHRKSE